AALALVLWGARSDRKGERVRHIVLALLVSAGALAASAYGGNLVLTMIALIVAAMAGFAAFGLFWTLPAAFLTGSAAAGGLALINSIGSLAGFGGPYLIGWLKGATGRKVLGLLVLSILPFVAALRVLFLVPDSKAEFERTGAAQPADRSSARHSSPGNIKIELIDIAQERLQTSGC